MEASMHIAPGVEMLELKAELMDGPNTFYPTLLWDQQDVVLVDAGLPGMASLIRGAIEQALVPFEKITRIIITHHDLDHIGSLGDLQRELPHPVQVLSHAMEVPYIQGELIPIKMTPAMRKQMEGQMKSVSEERRQAMQSMMDAMKNQKLKVDRTISDGEVLPYCGGIQIIHTPGHTPGHVCLFHITSKTMIAGDALFVENGKLVPAPSFINADTRTAIESLRKLAGCDITSIIAYHGGLYRDYPNQRLVQILHESGASAVRRQRKN
jgi:glyoxylase-like metal-dependent hydrolase (beta-lactamase superfamily II)